MIDSVVRKLFGYKQEKFDPNSVEFMKKCIEDAPNVDCFNHDRTSDTIIKEFLFEHTDIAKQLKLLMEKFKYEPQEENP